MRMDRLCVAVGTFWLFAAGCFSYGPYGQPGPYGTVPHTAMGPQPMIGGAPAGTVWIPATPSAPGKATLGPASVTAPEPVRRPTSETKDLFEEPSNGKAVPDPVDPSKDNRPVVEPTGYDEEVQVQPRGARTSQRSKPRQIGGEDVANSDREPQPLALDSEPELADQDNSSLQTAEFKTRVRAEGIQPTSAERTAEDNFGYDAKGYTWLKGVVEFDRENQSWHLTYDRSPADTDQFGGEVTFKNNYDFKKLIRSGQTILVKGRFDPDQEDRLGKPVYAVESLSKISK